jgi:LysR family hydrogen peroxide-inducible transcriptional activator
MMLGGKPMAEITLRQLRYLATLARALQYRRAAKRLGISQRSLSLHISALEEAVGAPLLERKRNGLILPSVGRDVAALRLAHSGRGGWFDAPPALCP